jgi:molybdopterin-containing oxidoreductase family iron-sulfur binding subunit
LVSGIQDKMLSCLFWLLTKFWQVKRSVLLVLDKSEKVRCKVTQLIKDMKAGSVHTLIMSGVNPVYTLADSSTFVEGLKIKTSVFSLKEDETALVSTIAAAVPHYLESWNDVSITKELTELHNQRFVSFLILNNFKMSCYL